MEVSEDNLANSGGNNVTAVGEDEKYSVEFYLDQIPTDPKVIDSLKTERNFANYQLGLIYKEKFKENLLAAGKLESVLKIQSGRKVNNSIKIQSL